MLTQVLLFLLETFLGLFALALLLRFHMQWLRAPPHRVMVRDMPDRAHR